MKTIIAVLVSTLKEKPEVVGYKILDLKTKEFRLWSEKTIVNNNLKLSNAKIENGRLVATQGSFDRYVKLAVESGEAITPRNFVILGITGDGYYVVVTHPEINEVKDIKYIVEYLSYSELKKSIKFAKLDNDSFIVANARVENMLDYKKMIVRPIVGKFEVIEEGHKYIEKEFDIKDGESLKKYNIRVVREGEETSRGQQKQVRKGIEIAFFNKSVDLNAFPEGQYLGSYRLSDILEYPTGLYVNSFSYIDYEKMKEIQNWLSCLNLKE